jgi:hypothetical protein
MAWLDEPGLRLPDIAKIFLVGIINESSIIGNNQIGALLLN